MKKNLLISVLILALFSPLIVNADNAGGTGGESGGGGHTGGSAGVLYDPGSKVLSGAYLFEFVYKPQGQTNRTYRKKIGCAVVTTGKAKGPTASWIAGKAQSYAKSHNCQYLTSGSMVSLASQLDEGKTVDELFPDDRSKRNETIILKYLNEFGVTQNDLTDPNDYNTGHKDSYGYRILIQRFIPFMKNGKYSSLKLRKEYANDGARATQLFGSNRAKDLKTTRDDIGIKSAASINVGRDDADSLKAKFKDYNNGAGYNILWLAFKSAPQVDYSVDAACVGCDDKETDANRSSYVIQDTTDWGGILRSGESNYMCASGGKTAEQNASITSSYFKTSTSCGDIYCREEVKVVFPNANDTPVVERGRYFTVHSPFRNEEGLVKQPYSPDYNEDVAILNENKYDHNWGAIKIIKTKECRMKKGNNENSCLTKNSESLKFKKSPEVKLTYKGKLKSNANEDEKKEFEKYAEELTNITLEVEPSSEFGSSTSNSAVSVTWSPYKSEEKKIESNYIYKTTQVSSYKLPKTMYRYILKAGGEVVSKDPGEVAHIDLGIATIPVSKNNKVYTNEDATLSLSFTLDNDMHLANSFSGKITLPSCGNNEHVDTIPNIYKYVWTKHKNSISTNSITGMNSTTEQNRINEISSSACAKLYLCSRTNNGMTCKKSGVDECIKNRTNNKIGNTNATNCYVHSQAKDTGNSNYICSVYVNPGIPDPPDIPIEDCPGCIDPDPRFDDGSSDPKCIVDIGNNVCLPATGYNKLIYRPIDLDNPFPAQTGNNRKTGINWCGYNTELKRFICTWDESNPVVSEYVLNNRGVDGDKVYSLEPMYSVTLDPDTINAVQKYNDTNSYDDFTLTCDTDGTHCELKKGTIIRESVDVKCPINSANQKCEQGGGS